MDNINAIATIKYLRKKIDIIECDIREYQDDLEKLGYEKKKDFPKMDAVRKELKEAEEKYIQYKDCKERMENTIIANIENDVI